MPSDPSGVSPRGVLVKPSPDFFDDHLAFGGVNFQFAAGNNFALISLFNNALSGVMLKVYALSVNNDGGGGMSAWMASGIPSGSSLVAPCSNVRADLGAPYGQIWQQNTVQGPSIPNPYTIPAGPALFGCGGFDSMTYVFPFPMFIVPVGFCLNLTNNSGTTFVGASFWYHQANE
jgi:hypothetical protein